MAHQIWVAWDIKNPGPCGLKLKIRAPSHSTVMGLFDSFSEPDKLLCMKDRLFAGRFGEWWKKLRNLASFKQRNRDDDFFDHPYIIF
jgi:hypothetical protein